MISAVIPAYNEEAILEGSARAVSRVLAQLSPGGWEIVLVDDGSRDQTAQVAARLAEDPRFRLVRFERNRGKGAAVRAGVLITRGDRVLILDADMSTPPEMLASFLPELDRGADIVIGDRRSPGARIERPQSLLRRLMGAAYATLARRISGISLRDFNCGFKLFRGEAARSLLAHCRSDRWTWDVEIIALAMHRGMNVRSHPVTWRQGGQSSVRPFRAAASSLIDLARLWTRLRRM
ncbi:MAG: glycosyltransferase [Nitrospirota bacterium]